MYVALFAPYSYERHQDFIAWSLSQQHCELYASCKTSDNHQVELLKIAGAPNAQKNVWIIARQHPAETMAEWFMEGLLEELLGQSNQLHQALLANTNFYVVANMNPDGSVEGNLRTNGMGIDLNRAWLNPNIQQAPESHFIFKHMKDIGVDLFVDVTLEMPFTDNKYHSDPVHGWSPLRSKLLGKHILAPIKALFDND